MLSLLLVLGCAGGAGDDSGKVGGLTGDATNGGVIFTRDGSCSGCHGEDGKLGTDIDGTPAADLTVRVPAMADNEITKQVKEGGTKMPPQLSEPQDVVDVIAYLRETFP